MELQMAQKYHGKFKVSRQFQFTYGYFNLLTAISILFTAISIYSRQFQFTYGYFNLLTAISILFTAISIYSRQFQFTHGNFNLLTTTYGNSSHYEQQGRFSCTHQGSLISMEITTNWTQVTTRR